MSGCRTVGASNSAARRGSAKGRPLLSAWVPELERIVRLGRDEVVLEGGTNRGGVDVRNHPFGMR
jgi:hypothetical protein